MQSSPNKLLKTHAKENGVDDDDAIECAIFSKQTSETHMQKENCVDVDDDATEECAIFSKQTPETHMQKENSVDVR
jgi:hypothetical protein